MTDNNKGKKEETGITLVSTNLISEKFMKHLLNKSKRATLPDKSTLEIIKFRENSSEDHSALFQLAVLLSTQSENQSQEIQSVFPVTPFQLLHFAHQILRELDPSEEPPHNEDN